MLGLCLFLGAGLCTSTAVPAECPSLVLLQANAQVGSLGWQSSQGPNINVADLGVMRANYTSQLMPLHLSIHSMEETILAMDATVDDLKRNNNGLLQKAQRLARDNYFLVQELHALEPSITSKQLIEKALGNASDAETEQRPVSPVLPPSSINAREQQYMHDVDSENFLPMLASSLDVVGEQQTSEASLAELFSKMYSASKDRLAELERMQAELNSTMVRSSELHSDLLRAVIRLETVKSSLESLKQHMKAPALLQLSSAASPAATSMEASDLLEKPAEVYEAMNSQVNALGARLAELNEEHQQAMLERTTTYEARLEEQRELNAALEKENEELAKEIEAVQADSRAFRTEAAELEKGNAALRLDLEALLQNISLAQDFVQSSLDSLDFSEDPELEILKTLAEQDASDKSSQEHSRQIEAVGRAGHSLLEFELDPQDMLQSMNAQLEELKVEMNSSSSALLATFEKKFTAAAKLQTSLLAKQKRLNETKASEEDLRASLEVAVDHLRKTQEELRERSSALQHFASKIGSDAHTDHHKTLDHHKTFLEELANEGAQIVARDVPTGAIGIARSWISHVASAVRASGTSDRTSAGSIMSLRSQSNPRMRSLARVAAVRKSVQDAKTKASSQPQRSVAGPTSAQAKATAQAKGKAQPQALAKTQAKTQAKAQPQVLAKTKAKAQLQAKVQAKAQLQAKVQAKAQVKAKATTAKVQTKAQVKAKATAKATTAKVQAKAQPQAKAKAQPQAQATGHAKAKVKAQTQAKAQAATASSPSHGAQKGAVEMLTANRMPDLVRFIKSKSPSAAGSPPKA
eukprot:CAMPEP_0170600776 /NCGR_PEP_ID=MMETSP0224-20130122/17510_1 /TAXON_ID=285029 /ORGANISM="Togula jolla, Strain CCCM 725" /LENGTH=808 /DNA_ID=CAMNT_0010925515 /DNA_START=90 /DNA_END=2516 /DNA_ORIENTATION=-